MHEQINKLTHLINDMLNDTKIQAGKLELKIETFSLHQLIKSIIADIKPLSPKHQIRLQGRLTKLITGDRERIGQVVINLLTNAIKYSPPGIIVVSQKQRFAEVVIGIRDFGIGIDPKYQHRVFERFSSIGNDNSAFGGLGLGLYISSEIIKRHKGKIWFESNKGKGTTFYFSLPVKS
jgi:signal transduction histidine kinase